MSDSLSSPALGFRPFLDLLIEALDGMAIDGHRLTCVFDPARRTPAAPGEILIGIGVVGDAHQGACLNNKGASALQGWTRDPITVASFIRDADGPLVEGWRARFSADPAAVLRNSVLVVEDASPDSVLSLLFWMSRLAGVSPDELPLRWLTSLTAWERDGIAASVTKSWTALLSALSHSHFGLRFSGEGMPGAWHDALRFTAALLRHGVDPDGIDPEGAPSILADAAYGRAIAYAMNERQDYLQSLSRAVLLELLVPMAGAPGRSLLVDAYFATEAAAPSGVKKVFIRSDTEHTTFGNGFALMGLYRPGLEGTGQDMTVSVDPRSGIALEALWRGLETQETERWGGRRPNANPRRIASYPDGAGFDQPWWDDQGRYTLLGAPKRTGDTGPGSMLSWTDVLETVWRSYCQLRDLKVIDAAHPAADITQIESCKAVSVDGGEGAVRHLLSMKWSRSEAEGQSLQFTPTVKRHLAAMLHRASEGKSGAVPLAELAAPEDFDYLDLAGGSAIVSHDGALLFDDWRDRDLGAVQLAADFRQAVSLLAASHGFDREVDALYSSANAPGGFRSGDMLRKVTELRARVAAAFQKASLTDPSPDRRAFRAALEARWGLDGKEGLLVGRLKDLQEIVETKATLDTQGMATLLAFVTIPAFIATVLQLYGNVISASTDDSGPAYAIVMLSLLTVLSLVAMIAAFVLTRRKG